MTDDPLKPPVALLVKLGSIAVHIAEFLDPMHSHEVDRKAIESLLDDQQVKEWISLMDGMALLPKRRGVEDLRRRIKREALNEIKSKPAERRKQK